MARVRTSNAISQSSILQEQIWSSSKRDDFVPSGWTGTKKSITDTNNGDFVRARKSGAIILSDCDIWTWTRNFSDMTLSWSPPWDYRSVWSGDCASAIELVVPRDDFVERKTGEVNALALIKAHAKIRDAQIMTGEIMSQIGMNLNMLIHPFQGARKHLAQAAKSAAKHYGKTARSVARANASAWLEYRYGLTPFLLDSRSAISMVRNSQTTLRKRRLVVRASHVLSDSSSKTFEDVPVSPLWGWTASGALLTASKVAGHAGVIFGQRDRTRAEQLSEDLRLGADSIIQTGWEIVPFSFVADWFISVGPWLEAMNLPPSISILGNWVTTRIDLDWGVTSSSVKMSVNSAPWIISGSGGTSNNTFRQSVRRCNQSLPTTPPIKTSMVSVLHATDGISLSMNSILKSLKALRH